MSALNPFDKEGKGDASFLDRLGIAGLFIGILLLSILIPVWLIKWYGNASDKHKALFWLVFILLALIGVLYDQWLHK